MAWPVSPTNGQQVTIANVLYQYSSSLGAWSKVQLAQPPYISDGNNVTISGNLSIPGTMSAASFSVANISVGNITASGNLTGVRFTGNVVGNLTGTASNATFATLAATANTVAGANVTGQVPYAAIANSVNGANVVGQVGFAAVANSVAGANVTGAVSLATSATSANSVAGSNVTGTVANATFATSAGTASSANSVAGANVSGTVATATTASTAGTVTTAAQPNITSVGTLSSLSVTGNTTTGGIRTDNYFYANGVSISFAGTYSNSNVAAYLPTYTGTVGATALTTGANTTAGSITGNWTLTAGSRLQATYADLAEYYEADAKYEPGTVLEFGGEKEVTLAQDATKTVAGVVTTNPAYVMNATCPGILAAIALQGRTPCKVRGVIKKGDMLISGGNGFARPCSTPNIGTVIGKALQDWNGGEGVIEVAVGRI